MLLLRTEAEALPQERVPDERALLRYIYLHCNEKLTLQTLADTFYLSRASISARLSAMTGLSFFVDNALYYRLMAAACLCFGATSWWLGKTSAEA